MEHIGNTIREIRKEKSVSQGELALECQISQTHMVNIEAGRAEPSHKLVERLLSYLGYMLLIYRKQE